MANGGRVPLLPFFNVIKQLLIDRIKSPKKESLKITRGDVQVQGGTCWFCSMAITLNVKMPPEVHQKMIHVNNICGLPT